MHVLVTDGCFYENGIFKQAQLFELKRLEEICADSSTFYVDLK
ncbi:MAG: hypothetical protein J7J52_06925 [Deltaproteobacteria bacterium]|nr:hypothetical protein [Deltaproteobacteria bacterium]